MVERVVLNALGKTLRLCRRIFAPSAIGYSSSSGEADPPWITLNGGTRCPQRVGNKCGFALIFNADLCFGGIVLKK
jgi:hypothetical protein